MVHGEARVRAIVVAVLALIASVALAACGSSSSDTTSAATDTGSTTASDTAAGGGDSGETYKVAFLAASSENGYSKAVFEGIQDEAKKLGNVEATIFDGQFDGEAQFNQMQDVAASGQYDGIVIVPNDTVSIGGAVSSAQAADIPVVSVLFPIGPNLTELEPQVPGVVATVASPPADGARRQAELAAEYCEGKDPCRVAILIGQVRFPFDKVRYDAYREVLDENPNMELVATLEGNYDRDQSLKAMQDALQSNPEIDVLLSNADQQTAGAQIALEEAGIDPGSVYITSAGGTKEAVAAVRKGDWTLDYVLFPLTEGEWALEQLVNALEEKPVKAVIDSDEEAPFTPFVEKSTLESHPEYTGQWSG